MRFDGYRYEVEARLTLTKAEVNELREMAAAHYDGKCKAEAAQGGFLYGWSMRAADLEDDQTIDVIVTWAMADRLCKILEMEHVHTGRMVHRVPWMQLLNEMRDEFRGANGPSPRVTGDAKKRATPEELAALAGDRAAVVSTLQMLSSEGDGKGQAARQAMEAFERINRRVL